VLIISRKENEAIRIEPAAGIDPSLTLREAFQHGPIVVKLIHVGGRRVRLVIDTPAPLKVWRSVEPTVAGEAGEAVATASDASTPCAPIGGVPQRLAL
jgi:sRNA-binding carbon storage regulator CsrA